MLIVNRADGDHSYQNSSELERMIEMKGERNYLFDQEERDFVRAA